MIYLGYTALRGGSHPRHNDKGHQRVATDSMYRSHPIFVLIPSYITTRPIIQCISVFLSPFFGAPLPIRPQVFSNGNA